MGAGPTFIRPRRLIRRKEGTRGDENGERGVEGGREAVERGEAGRERGM